MLKWVCLTMGYGHPKWLAGFVGKMLINHWIWGYPISLGHCKLNENVRIHSRPLTVQNHQQYMCFHTSPHSSYEKTDTSFLRIGRAHNDWGTKISESLLTPDRREDETIRIFCFGDPRCFEHQVPEWRDNLQETLQYVVGKTVHQFPSWFASKSIH